MSSFKKATKSQSKLRMAIQGPSGSGKTWTALSIASAIAQEAGGKPAMIDTERGSASKYAKDFDFDVCEAETPFHPETFIRHLKEADSAGYPVVVADSLTHYWNGEGGFLDLVGEQAKKSTKRDSFGAWKTVTPIYNKLISSILTSKAHVIVTLRAKQEYAKEQDDNGKTVIKKLGLGPEIRENFQYEMDIEGMLTMDHDFIIGKTRCREIDGRVFRKPGADLAKVLMDWLSDGIAPQSIIEQITVKLASEGFTPEQLISGLVKAGKVAETVATLRDIPEDMAQKVLSHWEFTKTKILANA